MTGSPKGISDYLPADAKTRQRTSGNELSRKGLARVRQARGRTPGLVVHYDIMRPFSRRFEEYASDPAIKALTEAGAALTVLTLEPTREALLEQFLKAFPGACLIVSHDRVFLNETLRDPHYARRVLPAGYGNELCDSGRRVSCN